MSLCSVSKYFENVEDFSISRVLYAQEGEIKVDGVHGKPLKTGFTKEQYFMYEIPYDVQEVTITPLVENAEFQYLDREYSFGKIEEETFGKLKVAKKDATYGEPNNFSIYHGPNRNDHLNIYCASGYFEQQVKWWKKYSSATMKLDFLIRNCDDAVRYEWSSNSFRVHVDQDGNVTNTGSFARSAKITLTAYDRYGQIVASSTVTVRFYKFEWQHKRLQSQEVVSDNLFRSAVVPTADEPETLVSFVSAFFSKIFRRWKA